jgi:hypothetical protein
VDYAFAGTDSLGRLGDGNDIAVAVVPAPSVALIMAGAMGVPFFRRRRSSR